jgi:hypothetical protein
MGTSAITLVFFSGGLLGYFEPEAILDKNQVRSQVVFRHVKKEPIIIHSSLSDFVTRGHPRRSPPVRDEYKYSTAISSKSSNQQNVNGNE